MDLRSLPEGALLSLFDLVAAPIGTEWSRRLCFGCISASSILKPEYAAVVDGNSPYLAKRQGAHALAATSRRLAEVFRTACVSTLLVLPQFPLPLNDEWDDMVVPQNAIDDAFKKFPAVDSVVFNHTDRMHKFTLDLQRVVNAPMRGITRVVLKSVSFRIGDVDDLKYTFPDLAELVLLNCTVCDIDLAMISWRLGDSLKKLRLSRTRDDEGLLTDAGAVGLHSMKELRVLCLDHQTKLTTRTFMQAADLSHLLALNVDFTSFDDHSAMALKFLHRLQILSVASCKKLTHAMLASLPPSLETLNISQTRVLRTSTPLNVFGQSPPVASQSLLTLQADSILLKHWKPLCNAPSLRHVYMRKCAITSIDAPEVFASWVGLRRLDISGCRAFVSNNDPAGPDAAIEGIALLATRVKELLIDSIGLTCAHWVSIIAKVMDSGESTKNLATLTLTRPCLPPRSAFTQPDFTTKMLVEAVPTMLRRTFPRTKLQYNLYRP